MINKYLSALIFIATTIVLIPGCDNTGSSLTELWRIKGAVQEYISETYAFDSTGSMIVQGMSYDAGGNAIRTLSRITSCGQRQWSVTIPSWGEIEIDRNNNVYFFCVETDYSSESIYRYRAAKYSPEGVILWEKSNLEAEFTFTIDYYTTIKLRHALDPSGNLFIMAKIGAAPGQSRIIKLDPAGNELWRQDIGVAPSRMITDASGNVYAGSVITVEQNEVYHYRVIKYDSATGCLIWDKICLTDVTSGGISTSDPLYMMIDNANNLVIVRHDSAATIDTFDPSGEHLWNYTFKPTDLGIGRNVDTMYVKFDGSNNAIISAVVTVQTGVLPLPSMDLYWPLGYQYCRLIKLDVNGSKTWSKKVSTVMIMNGDMGGQLNLDKENNIYVFCLDNAMIKYNTSGKKLWTYEPEITDVTMGQLSDWHVDGGMNLYWILQCGAAEMTDGYWITKYSQD